MAERKGDWMQTYTGVMFWPADPRPEEIAIEDIAHALANQCRYAGHVKQFYSVAQHSVHVAQIVPPEDALWGLLHDASEAYLVDLPRPIKHAAGLGAEYRVMETQLMRCIMAKYGLPREMPASVRKADEILLATEARDLMGPAPVPWNLHELPVECAIWPWAPEHAEWQFLLMARKLLGE